MKLCISPSTLILFVLLRSLRILPHDQDTGGFFIAVLTKTAPLPWERPSKATAESGETENRQDESQEKATGLDFGSVRKPARKKRRIQGYREDPFIFFEEDEPIWANIR